MNHASSRVRSLLAAGAFLLLATAEGGVVRDRNGRPVEPRIAAAAADLLPTGKGWGQREETRRAAPRAVPAEKSTPISPFASPAARASKERSAQPPRPKGANGIDYHGGPLLLGETRVYFIWYGDWTRHRAVHLLPEFVDALGGSPYFAINTTYADARGRAASNDVALAGVSLDRYSHGNALNEADVQAVIERAIRLRTLPADESGVYFVLTSADVSETSGFCTEHCSWHAYGNIDGQTLKYAFVGNPDRCPSACAAQTVSPNGDAAADAMANAIAQELTKAVTDPELDAWYDERGRENADRCAWQFGTTYAAPNGARANVKLGARHYLLQQNWSNAKGGYCSLAYP